MAIPAPSDKVKDKEYANWLKVTLALSYLKSGLETFIQSEIDCLHQSLVQKIYRGPTVPLPPCSMCDASHVIRNKYTGVWTFQKQCKSFCDVWLIELLKNHTNPKSEKIYWNNSHVPSWPFKSWECAKVFLPKGQQPSNTGPAESDAQALMVLLANCKHFQGKLSHQGQRLTNTISTIRNKVMHNGEMKVSDADRMSFIQQIIQLLEDPVCLKTLEDCKAAVSNIRKINNDSVDVFNLDLELTVLRVAVQELRRKHGMQKKNSMNNVDSLKEEFRPEQPIKRFEYVEKTLELVGERLAIIEKNVELHLRDLGVVERNVELHGARLDAVEENVKLKEEIRQLSRENNSCMKETVTKRRPETDGLQQLKNQTEDKLDTHRRLECILTEQAEKAKKLLEEKRSILIRGNPGEGKTTLALQLIDNEKYRDKRVVLSCSGDWKTVDKDWVDIVVLEDIFGKYEFDPGRLQEWMVYLPTIQKYVDAGKMQVIVTTRVNVLSKAFSKIVSLKLFSEMSTLTLSSEQLKNTEKMSILNKELLRHERNVKEEEKVKSIANFSGLIGFPQCCSLYAVDNRLFNTGPEFFRSSEKLFVASIAQLEDSRFLCLAFLFCNGEIYDEYLSPETMPESSKYLLMELASHLYISKKEASVTLLKDAYDSYLKFYVVKDMSYDLSLGISLKKRSIRFNCTVVEEAVGQVLGDRCPEMVVKYCDSEYLYQRTYTAEFKDSTSANVFIPVFLYGLLANRMVHDVAEKGLVGSVVKHTAFKQDNFLMKLKDELHSSNRIKDFFMAVPHTMSGFGHSLSEGECITFMQYILQGDKDVVKLVYSHFLEFLACTDNNNNSDCWKRGEKQELLELALYYHHFEIADKLITMNACYTHVSLCNAARHGSRRRVQSVLEDLKRSLDLNPECQEAKEALSRAFMSGNQDVIDILLKEGITLDSMHVVDAVQQGDIHVLMKVVEHLKCHSKWNPHNEQHGAFGLLFPPSLYLGNTKSRAQFETPCYTALYITYCKERFDMADYLLKNEVKGSLEMLADVSGYNSLQAVGRVLQNLKDAGTWDPHCDNASKGLESAYCAQKYDVCDLLICEGVSISMKNLPVIAYRVSLESVKKAVHHLKNTGKWDPYCDDASKALENAYSVQKYDVCDLLIEYGVLLSMKFVPQMILRSLEYVTTAVKQLKDIDDWDPKCDYATEALANAYLHQKYDVCDLLLQEGVLLTMKHFHHVLSIVSVVRKAIQHLKDTDNWDPTCVDASEALKKAYNAQKYDVCDLLIWEGVSLSMKTLPCVAYSSSVKSVKKAVQHLKDTVSWDPKCDDASVALANAYRQKKYDVCDLLIQEGVSLTMKNLPDMVDGFEVSLKAVKKAVQHLKDTDNWYPRSDHASGALQSAFRRHKYNVCDLLVQEGVSLIMKNLPHMILAPLVYIKTAVQHLKDINNWDPNCDYASEALENAYLRQNYVVCDLLVKEGISLTMKLIPHVIMGSLHHVETAVQQLKDTNNWDPKCDYASEALANAYFHQKYAVCNLLIQEGVSLTMKHFHNVLYKVSAVKKAIQHLKDTDSWDPTCVDASEALKKAYNAQKYDVCDLLIWEGVSLSMRNLPAVAYSASLEPVKKVIQHLKDTNRWDPRCDDASISLANAYIQDKYSVCDLLIQEGVTLTRNSLLDVVGGFRVSLESVQKAIQHLKDTVSWEPKCDDASKALERAFNEQKYDVCNLLIQEGVSLKMKHLPGLLYSASLDSLKRAIQHLKDINSWDPECDDASKALQNAYREQRYDVCDLLVNEGVTLKMKHLPSVLYILSLEAVVKVIQHLKNMNSWDPECGDALKTLEIAYTQQKYGVCDLLVQEGVSLSMKHLPRVLLIVSLVAGKKIIQHLKDTCSWVPECDDASKALENAFSEKKYDVCDLLVKEGVKLTIKNLRDAMKVYSISLESVKKMIQHLKDTDSWDPNCDDASKALENAFSCQKNALCDLLVQEGVPLTINHIPEVVLRSLNDVKTAVKQLKDTGCWDPKCDDASKALEKAYDVKKYDVCDLLVQEGVSLTMKNLPGMILRSLDYVKTAVKHLKDTDNWDPICDDASEALEVAYRVQKFDVCDLLIQEGVSLTMKDLLGVLNSVLLEPVEKVILHFKCTNIWNPMCDDASKALEYAYSHQKYDVCDLLVKEGVSLTMKNLPGVIMLGSLESFKKAVEHLKDKDQWDSSSDYAGNSLALAKLLGKIPLCDSLKNEGVCHPKSDKEILEILEAQMKSVL